MNIATDFANGISGLLNRSNSAGTAASFLALLLGGRSPSVVSGWPPVTTWPVAPTWPAVITWPPTWPPVVGNDRFQLTGKPFGNFQNPQPPQFGQLETASYTLLRNGYRFVRIIPSTPSPQADGDGVYLFQNAAGQGIEVSVGAWTGRVSKAVPSSGTVGGDIRSQLMGRAVGDQAGTQPGTASYILQRQLGYRFDSVVPHNPMVSDQPTTWLFKNAAGQSVQISFNGFTNTPRDTVSDVVVNGGTVKPPLTQEGALLQSLIGYDLRTSLPPGYSIVTVQVQIGSTNRYPVGSPIYGSEQRIRAPSGDLYKFAAQTDWWGRLVLTAITGYEKAGVSGGDISALRARLVTTPPSVSPQQAYAILDSLGFMRDPVPMDPLSYPYPGPGGTGINPNPPMFFTNGTTGQKIEVDFGIVGGRVVVTNVQAVATQTSWETQLIGKRYNDSSLLSLMSQNGYSFVPGESTISPYTYFSNFYNAGNGRMVFKKGNDRINLTFTNGTIRDAGSISHSGIAIGIDPIDPANSNTWGADHINLTVNGAQTAITLDGGTISFVTPASLISGSFAPVTGFYRQQQPGPTRIGDPPRAPEQVRISGTRIQDGVMRLTITFQNQTTQIFDVRRGESGRVYSIY